MKTGSTIKKILCDAMVATMATEVSRLVENGDLSEDQVLPLIKLDESYIEQALKICSGEDSG